MKACSFYLPEPTPALNAAAAHLTARGYTIVKDPHIASHILLPVPTKEPEKFQRFFHCSGNVIIGGNLPGDLPCRSVDLMKNGDYVAKNAEITADCAETLIRSKLPCSLSSCEILIIGWGRIGICLCQKLKRYCPYITVSTGDPQKAAICRALGYRAIARENTEKQLPYYRVIVNTAPADVPFSATGCRKDSLILELASTPGITGETVISAKGLPGKMEPETSGKLIAATVLTLMK